MLSKTSLEKLSTCDIRLQKVIKRAAEISDIDFGVAEGNRSIERQRQFFKEGKTKLDGVTQFSKHNTLPSQAVDIYGYVCGVINYSNEVMSYLAGVILTVAKEMGVEMIWGGNWDQDGEILTDQGFDDLPHFELK